MSSISSPQQVAAEIEQRLADPSALLQTTSGFLLGHAPSGVLEEIYNRELGEKPSLVAQVAKGALINALRPSIMGIGSSLAGSYKTGHARTVRANVITLIESFEIRRLLSSLNDTEKAVLRGMAALHADERVRKDEWMFFEAQMAFADGLSSVELPDHLARHDMAAFARQTLATALAAWLPKYEAFLNDRIAFIARHKDDDTQSGRLIAQLLSPGARWSGEGERSGSGTFANEPTPASLLIGYSPESGKQVFYSHNESLITIAGPGTGKSQCQVIPNLLGYPGSAVVLDVKGELWDATAAYRRQHMGPVFRFAPTDLDGQTHCFNPMDFVSTDPARASSDCELLANQIIPPAEDTKDPYWTNRARDFLWAFSMTVALDSPPQERSLASIMDLFSIPTAFEDSESPEFLRSPTNGVVMKLESLAERHQIPALRQAASAIRTGLDQSRLESVLDTGRGYLSIFARSHLLRQAMSRSDWTPLDLRNPGTTVYLCLPGDDIEAYLPIVRVILQQHAAALLRDSRHQPDVPPITFFLDEMPQLGPLSSLPRLLDVGRGAGVRLWLFAQYLGQLRRLYGNRADGLINSCRVRCYMQPDNDAVKLLEPQLGATRNLFDGKEQPLAHPYEMMGPQFADRIIVTARGELPVQLTKRYAWEIHGEQMEMPMSANPAA